MLKKIESLRKQPKYIRNRYAFFIALFFTSIIVIVWGMSLSAKLSQGTDSPVDSSDEFGEFTRTLGEIKINIDNTFQGASEELQKYKDEASSTQKTASTTIGISDFDNLSPTSSIPIKTVGRIILISTTTATSS